MLPRAGDCSDSSGMSRLAPALLGPENRNCCLAWFVFKERSDFSTVTTSVLKTFLLYSSIPDLVDPPVPPGLQGGVGAGDGGGGGGGGGRPPVSANDLNCRVQSWQLEGLLCLATNGVSLARGSE